MHFRPFIYRKRGKARTHLRTHRPWTMTAGMCLILCTFLPFD